MRVTRNVDPADAADLLERVPRAALAFTVDGEPEVEPVALVHDGGYRVGIPADAAHRPAPGDEVVLVVDEGVQWFDLRAVYVRGEARPAERPDGAPPLLSWFEVRPTRTVAWDYGSLRPADDDAP